MADIFTIVIERMVDYGFYSFLFPFIIFTAITYGLLRKANVFGEKSEVINGIIALVVGFTVAGFPVITGINMEIQMTLFFTQLIIFSLVWVFAFVIGSLFYPQLQEFLASTFKSRSMLFLMFILVVTFFMTSGLLGKILQFPPEPGSKIPQVIPTEVSVIVGGVILMIVIIIIGSALFKRGM